jgi:1,4-alpha-glucan branching enzyme
MIQKTYAENGRTCRVTFRLTPDGDVNSVHLAGEFNDWDPSARALNRRKDGSYSTTVVLRSGAEYRFRYVIDGNEWVNDPSADSHIDNGHGGLDSVVRV